MNSTFKKMLDRRNARLIALAPAERDAELKKVEAAIAWSKQLMAEVEARGNAEIALAIQTSKDLKDGKVVDLESMAIRFGLLPAKDETGAAA